MAGVGQEAAVEEDPGRDGRQARGQLHPALGIAKPAIDGGEVEEALAHAVYLLGSAVTGGGIAEAGFGYPAGDLLHGVDEVDIELLRVVGMGIAAISAKQRRRGGVGRRICERSQERVEEEEDDEGHRQHD